jgi:error-prone DNA polymerase
MAEGGVGVTALRLGFRQVKGLKAEELKPLVERRGAGYLDLADLRRRSGVSAAVLDRLARADAFTSLALDRRGALWRAIGLERTGHERDLPPLFAWAEGRSAPPEPAVALPRMTLGQDVAEDYANLRLSLRAHPLALLRRFLRSRVVAAERLAALDDGRPVAVAGLTLVRQRPGTASGVIFITLEDETGVANLVVWPKTFERFRRVVLGAQLMVVQGQLQKEGLVIHVIAERLVDRSDLLRRLAETNQAFRSPLAHADHAKGGAPPDPRDPFWRPRDLDHFRSHPHIYRGVLEPPEARSKAGPRPLDPGAAGFKSRDFH